MQMLRDRLMSVVLAACLLVALAFGGVVAYAAGNWWTPGGNTLTVSTDNEQLVGDISDGMGLYVDIYKVADAKAAEGYEDFTYTLVGKFNTSTIDEMLKSAEASGGDAWRLVAETMAQNVVMKGAIEPDSHVILSAAAGVATTGALNIDEDGLYLIIPRTQDVSLGVAEANGLYSKYSFTPSIAALPMRDEVASGSWYKDVSIGLKVEVEPLYGSLEIAKVAVDEDGNEAVPADPLFVEFEVTSVDGSKYKYHDYVSVRLDGESKGSAIAEHIPAGIYVTVTEHYQGSGYTQTNIEYPEGVENGQILIPSDESVAADLAVRPTVRVTDAYVDDTPGDGIDNKYEYDGNDWHLVSSSPSDKVRESE